MMYDKTAYFRFYEELNDFISSERKKIRFPLHIKGTPTVKDIIESIGVPHTEVELILVNNVSVDFKYIVQDQDYVSVYPVFETFDITPIICLRPKPLRKTKFVLDVNLGKLAKYLRLLGFDTEYSNSYSDPEVINISIKEKRIILTRDIGILKTGCVTHGYWVRSTKPKTQIIEVVKYFHLESTFEPFTRCIKCNGILIPIDKNKVRNKIPLQTYKYYDKFQICSSCSQIYWQGSHYEKMKTFIKNIS